MKKTYSITLLLFFAAAVLFSACNRNYYSGTGKGSGCGCPNTKGMSGY